MVTAFGRAAATKGGLLVKSRLPYLKRLPNGQLKAVICNKGQPKL